MSDISRIEFTAIVSIVPVTVKADIICSDRQRRAKRIKKWCNEVTLINEYVYTVDYTDVTLAVGVCLFTVIMNTMTMITWQYSLYRLHYCSLSLLHFQKLQQIWPNISSFVQKIATYSFAKCDRSTKTVGTIRTATTGQLHSTQHVLALA